MRVIPNILHLCLKTIPLVLPLLLHSALAAPSFETLAVPKGQYFVPERPRFIDFS